jgi:TolB-like protein/DNA-binding winged helix-turn-helix (wHTH) protein
MPQTETSPPNLKFGVFEVDRRSGELTRLGKRVRLQEQPFQLLVMLLEKPGVLVTREELHPKLWPETTVDFDHGLNKAISKIREALGDSAESPRFIETVARRGYKFLADVKAVEDEPAAPEALAIPDTRVIPEASDLARHQDAEPASLGSATVTLSGRRSVRFFVPWVFGGLLVLAVSLLAIGHPSKPASSEIRSIAVLPLQNFSNDVSQDYFTDGMTDELITDLAQIRRLQVIAPPSPIDDKNSAAALREIARRRGVDAVVTGSVSFSSDRVRITARLVDVRTQRDLWAQSYDGDIHHTLKTQSEIAHSIAEQLRSILDRQKEAALKKPTG